MKDYKSTATQKQRDLQNNRCEKSSRIITPQKAGILWNDDPNNYVHSFYRFIFMRRTLHSS